MDVELYSGGIANEEGAGGEGGDVWTARAPESNHASKTWEMHGRKKGFPDLVERGGPFSSLPSCLFTSECRPWR